jgi:hypothetical protein
MTEDLGILMEHLHYLISGQSVTRGVLFYISQNWNAAKEE